MRVLVRNIEPEMVETIPISEILVAFRRRVDKGDISELAADIREVGLIHPIAVKRLTDYPDGYQYQLLAGERRLMAVRDKIGSDTITANIYPADLSALEIKYIELIENIGREKMEYQEECDLKNDIHQLQCEISGEKTGGGVSWEGHSITDTAKLFKESATQTSADIELSQAIKEIPALGKMKNKSEAMKAWNRIKEKLIVTEMATRIPVKPDSLVDKELIDSYVVGDTMELITAEESESYDLIEIDSPFGIGLSDSLKQASADKKKEYNEWTPEQYAANTKILCEESYRLLKEGGWLIIWFAQEPWYDFVKKVIRSSGFDCNGITGIWSKGVGQCNHPNVNLASSYEMFFYARKGEGMLTREGHLNVFNYRVVPVKYAEHLTPKPIELYQDLLSIFVRTGQSLLVPFAGSGNAMLAAANLRVRAKGYDNNKLNKDIFIYYIHHVGRLDGEYKSYTKEE